MKRCPYCSAEIHEKAYVCDYCGHDLMKTVPRSVAVTPNTQEQVEKISKVVPRIITVFSIILLITCMVVIYIFLLNSY